MKFPIHRCARTKQILSELLVCIVISFILFVFSSGCASKVTRATPDWLLTGESPAAEIAAPAEAWREAQAWMADRPGSDALLALGESMLPLYRSRTLLLIEPQLMETFKAGQTVVFYGDGGSLVAHLLVAKTGKGWLAAGAANAECDQVLVTSSNYLGTVSKAYELTAVRRVSDLGLIGTMREGSAAVVSANIVANAP